MIFGCRHHYLVTIFATLFSVFQILNFTIIVIDGNRFWFVFFNDGDVSSRWLVLDGFRFFSLSPGPFILILDLLNVGHWGLPSLLGVSLGFVVQVVTMNIFVVPFIIHTSNIVVLARDSCLLPCSFVVGIWSTPLLLVHGFRTSHKRRLSTGVFAVEG